MKKAKVYVQGRSFNEMTASVFRSEGSYEIVNDLTKSDIVVWTGGEDINPVLYGEKPIHGTHFTRRDIADVEAIETAVSLNKFLVGICRGAQLLNVIPNGGSMWQDCDRHNSGPHTTFDCVSGTWIETNSVHHQQMRVTDKAEIIAWAAESNYKKSEKESWRRDFKKTLLEKDKDVEACWYPDTQSLLVQWHPEFGHPETTRYFHFLMDKYYWMKIDSRYSPLKKAS